MKQYRHILVVDDDRAVRQVLRFMLEELGYDVTEAEDGEQALATCHERCPDLLLTDLHMPRMDGKRLITEALSVHPELPVVAVSGQSTIQDALEVIRLGALDYLVKPVQSTEELRFVLQRVFDRVRLRRENQSYRDNLEELVNRRTEQLQIEEQRYRALFESARDAIVIFRDDRIHDFNKSAQTLFGKPAGELYGKTLLDFSPLLQPDDLYSDDMYSMYRERLLAGEAQMFEWRLCRHVGDCFDVEIGFSSFVVGEETFFQALIRDASERKQYLDELYQRAHYDELTGLPNRFLLEINLTTILENLAVTGGNCYLFLVNINRLQHINDTLGHSRGDELIRQVGQRLLPLTSCIDGLSRFIGNEFMLLAPQLKNKERAFALAEQILSLLQEPFQIDSMDLFVSANIGICACPQHGDTVETLFKNVEAAMYQARQQGENGVTLYCSTISDSSKQLLSLENQLHRALERDEFQLHYQPQLSLTHQGIVGAEALLRWYPTGAEPVSPMQFIPVLEDSGLIIPVGAWVLDRACAQLRCWIDLGLPVFELSVNVSPLQFHRGNLLEHVRSALQRHRLDPKLLCLELTERLILDNVEHTLSLMRQLRELGVSLSIDDFGTGYSSLSYLSRMPIHELKIDRSFVKELPHNPQGCSLVDSIIGMATGLGLRVVAEGVETATQRDYLKSRHCQRGQGYFYSRPLPADQFALLFNQERHR